MSTAPGVRKRQDTVCSSITRLLNRLSVLESKATEPTTFDLVQDVAKRLNELDQEFRKYHYQLLDLIVERDEEALAKEQADLDGHDDVLDDASTCIKQLLILCQLFRTQDSLS